MKTMPSLKLMLSILLQFNRVPTQLKKCKTVVPRSRCSIYVSTFSTKNWYVSIFLTKFSYNSTFFAKFRYVSTFSTKFRYNSAFSAKFWYVSTLSTKFRYVSTKKKSSSLVDPVQISFE